MRDLTLAVLVGLSMASFSSRKYARGYSDSTDDILSQQTRQDIYNLIKQNEGSHFRMICRDLDKKIGVIQYHIGVLEKNGLIRSVKDGRYKCFFATNKGTNSLEYQPTMDLDSDQRILRESLITSMKRETPKKIIKYILENGEASHQILAKISSVSPQAITFHCQKLQKINIIQSIKVGRQKFYSISNSLNEIMKYIEINKLF